MGQQPPLPRLLRNCRVADMDLPDEAATGPLAGDFDLSGLGEMAAFDTLGDRIFLYLQYVRYCSYFQPAVHSFNPLKQESLLACSVVRY
jgi:hypothetical protein